MGVAGLHRGDSGTYRCDAGTLGCHAGLGVRPVEVYLPPAARFDDQVPAWARGQHGPMCRAFEALGARVVILPHASVWAHEGPIPPG